MVNITNVQASVIDIRHDRPRNTDRFLLDSNVLIWQTYSRAFLSFNFPNPYQIRSYPRYLRNALNANAALFHCTLSFSEISHVIEAVEFKFYNSQAGNPQIPNVKEFRHNHQTLRTAVVNEIQNDWNIQIQNISQQISIDINSQILNNAVTRMGNIELDGYDYFMLDAMQQNNVTQIITDDADYITAPNITVFTANPNAIRAAQQFNKLIHR